VRLTPQFLPALHLELFTKPSFFGFFTSSSERNNREKRQVSGALPLFGHSGTLQKKNVKILPYASSSKYYSNPLGKLKKSQKPPIIIIGKKKREVNHGRLDYRRGFYFFLRIGLFRSSL
jgi:hypothetical protein